MMCGFDGLHQQTLQTDRDYQQNYQNFEQQLLLQNGGVATRNNPTYVIPVVVHIMHLPSDDLVGTGSNISDAQVEAGLTHLNDAFRNINAYSGGPFYTNSGISSVDTEIEFCLSTIDPSGNVSTGINRVATTYSNLFAYEFGSSGFTKTYEMQMLSNWNSNNYLNIWLVNSICQYSTPSGCGIAGLSTFPPSHGYLNDGVVLESVFWGVNTNDSKVAVHEIGHYLGLYHTFEGGCSETNCMTGGDRVCDTPPDNSTGSGSTGTTMNTCSNDAIVANSSFTSDVEDIYENYMDYGSNSMKNTFTPGQKTRMDGILATTRASLFNNVVVCNAAILPVELLSYEASLANKFVQLRWVTTNQVNNDYFLLEKRVGEGDFEFLTKISADNMPSQLQQYVHLDEVSFNQEVYYKLIQVDKDGAQHLLGIRHVTTAGEITTTIVPNPISSDGYLKYTSYTTAKGHLTILNTNGQIVFQEEIDIENGTNLIALNISGLPNGLYVSVLSVNNESLCNRLYLQ